MEMIMMTARNPVYTLVAFDPDGGEHTIARTSARYDYAGFIRVAARAGQPEGWYPVAKGFAYKSVHARTRSAHLHDALSYDYRTVKVWRKGSESYERNLVAAQAKAEDLARTNRRQARLPERLATVEAANAAGASAARRKQAADFAAQLGIDSGELYAGAIAAWSNMNPQSVPFDRALSVAAVVLRAARELNDGDDGAEVNDQSADEYAAIERGEL